MARVSKLKPNILSCVCEFQNWMFIVFETIGFLKKKTIRWDSGGIPLRVTLSPAFLRLKSKAGYRWWFPEEIFLTLLILLIVTILLVNWYYWYWHCWYNILPSVMHIAYAYVMHDWRTRLEICDCGVDKSLNPILFSLMQLAVDNTCSIGCKTFSQGEDLALFFLAKDWQFRLCN